MLPLPLLLLLLLLLSSSPVSNARAAKCVGDITGSRASVGRCWGSLFLSQAQELPSSRVVDVDSVAQGGWTPPPTPPPLTIGRPEARMRTSSSACKEALGCGWEWCCCCKDPARESTGAGGCMVEMAAVGEVLMVERLLPTEGTPPPPDATTESADETFFNDPTTP